MKRLDYDKYIYIYEHSTWTFKKRLYHCTADIIAKDGIIYLKSYKTIIAIYDSKNDNTLFDALRAVYGYTSTSCQHVRKFYKWLNEKGYKVSNIIRVDEWEK